MKKKPVEKKKHFKKLRFNFLLGNAAAFATVFIANRFSDAPFPDWQAALLGVFGALFAQLTIWGIRWCIRRNR